MKSRYIDLIQIGWNEWFEERVECGPEYTIARVAAVDRDLLLLMDQNGTCRAKLTGSYLCRNHLSQELPCVGDWVYVKKHPTDDLGLVHMLLERKTALRRKSAGDSIDYQMIAANVDYVIIVQSCHYDFNLKRLERYLVMVRDGGGNPYCLFGSSGVGKSTIINQLIGREMLQTKGISGTGEGRHTTVRRELIILECGALVIDNPGMREFGILGAETGIGGSFSDIIGFASGCRYGNCSHTSEPGCAVLEALNSGDISQEHYDNYIKLREESEFYQMSYVEKRKKDRNFGRYIKSAKKDLKNY